MSLFVGRQDVYAYAWENVAKGTKGWAPARENAPGKDKEEKAFLPLTRDVIRRHMWDENASHKGIYVILPGGISARFWCVTSMTGTGVQMRGRMWRWRVSIRGSWYRVSA